MAMDENAKKMVDSIMEIVNTSETYSFEENPAPIFNILLKKWEQMLNFQHKDLPNGLLNRWEKLTFSESTIFDSNMLSEIEKIVNDNVNQKEMTILNGLINLSCRLDRSDYIEGINFVLQVVGIQRLWMPFEDCEENSFVENLTSMIKILVDQYFEYNGKCVDELPISVKKVWDSICESSEHKTFDFTNIFEDKLTMFKSDDGLLLLDAALFFIKKYESSYNECARDNRPSITPWLLKEFIYGLKLDYVANKLWSIVNDSYTYSFKKEPLPAFQVLVDYYTSNHAFDEELPKKWKDTLDELKNNTHNCITNTARELFKKFREVLDEEIKHDEILLANVVDFFVEKYAELHPNEGGEYILSKELVNFIYWSAVGGDGCTTELALYNPFTGLGTFAKHHAESLREQLYGEIEDAENDNDINSLKESYNESSWYCGVESNSTNRLIGNVRLFVHNPTNLNQMHITSDDSLQDEIGGYTGGWTFIATPPIASEEVSEDVLIDITRKLIDKFVDATGMSDAFFVLPKTFCYAESYSYLRRMIVNKGLLGTVVELPSNVFNVAFDGVVVYLSKPTTYSELKTMFVDAKNFSLDDIAHNLFLICLGEEESSQSVMAENGDIAQYDYCLLPSLYIPENVEKKPGEINVRLGELISNVKGTQCKDKVKYCIAERSFRNDYNVIFEDAILEECNGFDKLSYFSGEHLVVTFMRDKFLLCKTSADSSFCLKENQVAFKLTEGCMASLDYVIYSLLRCGYLKRLALSMTERRLGNGVIQNILNSDILVHPDRNMQENELFGLKTEFERLKGQEAEAEKQRSAHREASSDISHMLGTTFATIDLCLMELEEFEGVMPIAKQIKDCFDYMQRFIDSVGQDFSDLRNSRIIKEEMKVNDFIYNYCQGWKNYGKHTFEIQYNSLVDDETTFMINEVYMKVLLDTLLDNVYRHGFERFKSKEHKARISTSYTYMDDKKYVLLSVSNNGKPFPKDFSIEKYISRGEFCGDTGRTGLGGNHVYNIAKSHSGFINLTSDDEWNVIVEVLIPLNYYDECETDKFIAYGNAKECI